MYSSPTLSTDRIPKVTTSARKFVFKKKHLPNDWQMIPCLLFQEVHTPENEPLVHEKNHPALNSGKSSTPNLYGFGFKIR